MLPFFLWLVGWLVGLLVCWLASVPTEAVSSTPWIPCVRFGYGICWVHMGGEGERLRSTELPWYPTLAIPPYAVLYEIPKAEIHRLISPPSPPPPTRYIVVPKQQQQ